MIALAVVASLFGLFWLGAFMLQASREARLRGQLRDVVSRVSRETRDWAEGRKAPEAALREINRLVVDEIRTWPDR